MRWQEYDVMYGLRVIATVVSYSAFASHWNLGREEN